MSLDSTTPPRGEVGPQEQTHASFLSDLLNNPAGKHQDNNKQPTADSAKSTAELPYSPPAKPQDNCKQPTVPTKSSAESPQNPAAQPQDNSKQPSADPTKSSVELVQNAPVETNLLVPCVRTTSQFGTALMKNLLLRERNTDIKTAITLA